ncbi:DUF4296 domain-containing protein [Flavobacterium sp. CS20]|uniref:DUF4296 domain-containing protein n=1 Tax=Flavobacterium sp. CS20 TaxID=2775246 RepID=UPI001B3A21F1|nr:DUF4296 domain-containing protein [Flavobacterium sp. CS20]QTY26741.1 DUF4296 domain-containing protein [Flavobacterium sp. CS20]
MHNALNLIDRKYICVLTLAIFVVWSCDDVQKQTKPDKLLSQDKMVEIYTDMLILDGVYRTNSKKFETYGIEPTEHIYNKFDIDSLTLAQNMNYYNLDFEANIKIYEQVQKNIEAQKQIIDSIDRVNDSLRRLKTETRKPMLKDSISLSKKMMKVD